MPPTTATLPLTLILQLLPDDTEIFNTRIDALPGACTDVSPERATPS